jgi:hypothetical protein
MPFHDGVATSRLREASRFASAIAIGREYTLILLATYAVGLHIADDASSSPARYLCGRPPRWRADSRRDLAAIAVAYHYAWHAASAMILGASRSPWVCIDITSSTAAVPVTISPACWRWSRGHSSPHRSVTLGRHGAPLETADAATVVRSSS